MRIRIGFGLNTKGKGKHWNGQMVKMYQAKCYPTQNRMNKLEWIEINKINN